VAGGGRRHPANADAQGGSIPPAWAHEHLGMALALAAEWNAANDHLVNFQQQPT
jgi:hypothetical protein